MLKKLAIAAISAVAVSSAAHAEPFSGPYIGVSAGMDNHDLSTGNAFSSGAATATLDGLSGNGIVIGGYAGYDFSFGGAFVGIEAGMDFSDSKFKATLTNGANSTVFKGKVEETVSISARLGAKVGDSTGIYGKVGWADTHFKAVVNTNGVEVSDGNSQSAINFGLGVETYFASNISGRMEYTITDYGNALSGVSGAELDNGAFRVGVSYRF